MFSYFIFTRRLHFSLLLFFPRPPPTSFLANDKYWCPWTLISVYPFTVGGHHRYLDSTYSSSTSTTTKPNPQYTAQLSSARLGAQSAFAPRSATLFSSEQNCHCDATMDSSDGATCSHGPQATPKSVQVQERSRWCWNHYVPRTIFTLTITDDDGD